MGSLPLPPPKQSDYPVGGCLSRAWVEWSKLETDTWVAEVVRFGYQISFREYPPLSSPVDFRSYGGKGVKFHALDAEVCKMLEKGAIELVPFPDPGFYSRMFVVPKPGVNKWRPIIDLSVLNKWIDVPKCKFETNRSVMQALRQGDWMASVDLRDAYFQIPIHPESRKFLRFVWKGKTYQFKVLCFGLSPAPQVFTRVFGAPAAMLHSQGIRLIRYLDDWLILADSRNRLLKDLQQVLLLCKTLCISINLDKSDLSPTQTPQYLGMVLDSRSMRAFPSEDRIQRFTRRANEFLADPAPQAWRWEMLLGTMASLTHLVSGGRLRMRPLQWCLRRQWSRPTESSVQVIPDGESVQAVSWFLLSGRLTQGVSLSVPVPSLHLWTDASLEGWGAHSQDWQAQGLWSPAQARLHINVLELKAMLFALRALSPTPPPGSVIALQGDNTTALAYVRNQGGTHSFNCLREARKILLWAEEREIQLVPRFVPGELNVRADALSREFQILQSEWVLHPDICRALWKLWGTPLVDLFASSKNNRLPNFCSPLPEPEAWGTDAFLQDWTGLELYAYPPTKVLGRVLQKFRQSPRCRLTLVAPCWVKQAWFPDVLDLLVDHPRRLPARPNLLRQTYQRHVFCTTLDVLQLHAWRLSNVCTEHRAFREQCTKKWPGQPGTPQLNSTKASGSTFVLGVIERARILSMPLFL